MTVIPGRGSTPRSDIGVYHGTDQSIPGWRLPPAPPEDRGRRGSLLPRQMAPRISPQSCLEWGDTPGESRGFAVCLQDSGRRGLLVRGAGYSPNFAISWTLSHWFVP